MHQLVDDLAIQELDGRSRRGQPASTCTPERREHRRVLDADHSGSHRRQRPRLLRDSRSWSVEHDLAVGLHAGSGEPHAHRDDHVAGGNHSRPLRPGWPGCAGREHDASDERDVIPAQLLLDHLDLPPDDGFDSGQEPLRGGRLAGRAQGKRSPSVALPEYLSTASRRASEWCRCRCTRRPHSDASRPRPPDAELGRLNAAR